MVLEGRSLSKSILDSLSQEVSNLSFSPGLAVIQVGNDAASSVYVGHKIKTCKVLGYHSEKHLLSDEITSTELKNLIWKLNQDPSIDGILVQLPLPKHLDSHEVACWIDPAKDVDVLGPMRVGELALAKQNVAPCTPSGIIDLLENANISLEGMDAVVVGRSNIVGKPMFTLLEQKGATVTLCHSKTQNLKAHTSRADLVVAAMGKAEFLGKEYFKKDAIVVDVGMHRKQDGSLCGDTKQEEIKNWVKAYSPVPGGVGPLTIAYLMKNTLLLAKLRRGQV